MSNTKLKENKQVMSEDWNSFVSDVLPILTMGLLAAIQLGFTNLFTSNKKSSMLSDAVYDSLDDIYKD